MQVSNIPPPEHLEDQRMIKKKQDRIEKTKIIAQSPMSSWLLKSAWTHLPLTINPRKKNYKLRLMARQSGTGRGVLLAITNHFIISDVSELQTCNFCNEFNQIYGTTASTSPDATRELGVASCSKSKDTELCANKLKEAITE